MYRKIICLWWRWWKRRSIEAFVSTAPDVFLDLVHAAQPRQCFSGGCLKAFDDYTFDEMEILRYAMTTDFTLENFREALEVGGDVCFRNLGEVVAGFRFLVAQVEKAAEMEATQLGNPDPFWIAAGGSRLEKFRGLGTKIFLSKSFGVLPDEIGRLKWTKVFVYLAYERAWNEVTKKYTELKAKEKT